MGPHALHQPSRLSSVIRQRLFPGRSIAVCMNVSPGRMSETTVLRQRERGKALWPIVMTCTEVNGSIVGQALAGQSLSYARWQLGRCPTPLSPWQRPADGGGECDRCLPIKPVEGSAWLCPLSGQDVGGAAVARYGITGLPDPAACLGHPGPPTLLTALGSSGANRRGSVVQVLGDSRSVLLPLGRLFANGTSRVLTNVSTGWWKSKGITKINSPYTLGSTNVFQSRPSLWGMRRTNEPAEHPHYELMNLDTICRDIKGQCLMIRCMTSFSEENI